NLDMGNGKKVARRGGFYNNREQKWVYMLNVNLHDLLAWNRAQPSGSRLIEDPDEDGEGGTVVFLTVRGPAADVNIPNAPDPGLRYAVGVFGSPNLAFPPAADPTGVTVVSDQAIYVEGNYNVSSDHPLYDATHPWVPAALMGDTINVLSANWTIN